MKAPQIIMLIIYGINLGVNLIKHGESKKADTYNFWVAVISVLINTALLKWGGFF